MFDLHADLNSAFIARPSLSKGRQEIGDVVPRMSVKAGAQLQEQISYQVPHKFRAG